MNIVIALYGLIAYAVSLSTILYTIGFVSNLLVPKSVDIGFPAGMAGEPIAVSLLIDALLLGVFAVQHSVMARPAFKRWWTLYIPKSMERSTYVLLASAALMLLFAQWRPLGATVWNLTGTSAGTVLNVLMALGWGLAVLSTFQIDHFDLFGLKQVWNTLRRHDPPPTEFRTPLLYRQVRHPIYLGFILAFWCTPIMTAGHLLFAAMTTGYILVGIWFEERDLIAQFGHHYHNYRDRVGMLLPRLPLRKGSEVKSNSPAHNSDA